jgi:hypothetical protein
MESPEETDEELFARMSQLAQRAAFYAGLWSSKSRRFTQERSLVLRWIEALPDAMEREYQRLDAGELPRLLSLKTVLSDKG